MAFGSRVDERIPSATASKRPRYLQVRRHDRHARKSRTSAVRDGHHRDTRQCTMSNAAETCSDCHNRRRDWRLSRASDTSARNSQQTATARRNRQRCTPRSSHSAELQQRTPRQVSDHNLVCVRSAIEACAGRPDSGLSIAWTGSILDVAQPTSSGPTLEASCPLMSRTCQLTTAIQEQKLQRNIQGDLSARSSSELPFEHMDEALLAQWVAAEMAAHLEAQVPLCFCPDCAIKIPQ